MTTGSDDVSTSSTAVLTPEASWLISGLEKERASEFLKEIRIESFPAGSELCTQGEIDVRVRLVNSGIVKLISTDEDQPGGTLSFIGPGDLINGYLFIEPGGTGTTAIANTFVTTASIYSSTLKIWMRNEADISFRIARHLTRRIREARKVLEI